MRRIPNLPNALAWRLPLVAILWATPAHAGGAPPELSREQASDFARLALKGTDKEYPNKPGHVLGGPDDVKGPKALHPAFYGCYDWHSSVHGHWMLARLLRLFPDLPEAGPIRSMLKDHLTAEKLRAEADYFARKDNKSFERPYGWAWLLKLAEDLHGWDDPDAREWSKNLEPLASAIVARYLDFFPKQTYPIRTGVHPNTAFGLAFAHDYARAVGDARLKALVEERARAYFGPDVDAPARWEPSGADFFSPSLMEADLMRRVLPPAEFRAWFARFLPGVARGEPGSLLTPATVTDRTDPQLVHLDGLNLSRAWCMRNIADALPAGDPARAALEASSARHAASALGHVASGEYAGEHWLASFAVYLLTPSTVRATGAPRVAGIATAYFRNSHADMIIGRLLQTDTLDDRGRRPSLELASLYTDQTPPTDIGRGLARQHGVPVFEDVEGALTLGTGRLAVDGVLLVAEHGKYPRSETGQIVYPKRRLFAQVLDVFDRSHRVVPVSIDKHLADNWTDARWIYDEARRRKIPMMAGSSLPVLWRHPPADVRRGAALAQIVLTSYHTLDAYGFHAVEAMQCLAERRRGGETGVRSVRCITGPAVWRAGAEGVYDRALLDAALARLERRPPPGRRIEDLVPEPVLFVVDYRDGLRGCVFTLNGAVAEWAAAWRSADDRSVDSTLFHTQEARPFGHFSLLLMGIERMMQTGRPTWPVERTLLTSGILDAALRSKRDGGRRLETPWLDVSYTSDWNWTEPPAPPPGRGH